ncbi:HlyD family efflux transporter periplasmic adaptor subunit [bacterium]|nr:HlyD family efflux transporter periplasmic adaptor subunit [bacterium]
MKEGYNNLEALILEIYSVDQKDKIDEASSGAIDVLNISEEHLYDMQNLLNNTITGNDFTRSQLNSFKSTINSNRSSINTKIDSLDNDIVLIVDAKDSLEDYQENYDDNLADLQEDYQDALDDLGEVIEEVGRNMVDLENTLESKRLSLEETKIKHDDLLAPLSGSELASLNSRLTSASVLLEKARNNLDKAVLTSPIDGKIVSLNYKTGDIILDDDSSPFVEIVNDKTLFIETNVEEVDISKLSVDQKVYATFDALDGIELEGETSFISVTSETSSKGIVTYLVRIIFEKGENDKVREGMTAYVEFITAGVEDVLVIPVSAVRNVEGKPSVQLFSGSRVKVVTGFTDGDYVEIISGLSLADKIIY